MAPILPQQLVAGRALARVRPIPTARRQPDVAVDLQQREVARAAAQRVDQRDRLDEIPVAVPAVASFQQRPRLGVLQVAVEGIGVLPGALLSRAPSRRGAGVLACYGF